MILHAEQDSLIHSIATANCFSCYLLQVSNCNWIQK